MAELRNKHIRQKIIFSFPAANLSAVQKLEESKTFFIICQKRVNIITACTYCQLLSSNTEDNLRQAKRSWNNRGAPGNHHESSLNRKVTEALLTHHATWDISKPWYISERVLLTGQASFLKLLTLFRGHRTPPTRNGLGCGSNHLGRDILHCPSQYQLF